MIKEKIFVSSMIENLILIKILMNNLTQQIKRADMTHWNFLHKGHIKLISHLQDKANLSAHLVKKDEGRVQLFQDVSNYHMRNISSSLIILKINTRGYLLNNDKEVSYVFLSIFSFFFGRCGTSVRKK